MSKLSALVAGLALTALFAGGCVAEVDSRQPGPGPVAAEAQAPPVADPHLWLEAIDDDKALAWVRAQNARSFSVLEGDPRYETLYREALEILNSEARIPYGDVHGEFVYNFWTDRKHVRGLWRRASLASYISGDPDWQTLLDIDELDRREKENWIFQGYDCLGPAYELCMLRLSRGGTDASVFREFSISQRDFVADGFVLPQAKSSVEWVDADTLLIGTDWGDGLTDSGYARTIKKWKRGTDLSDSQRVFRGEKTDVGVFALVYRDGGVANQIAVRARTFFESEYVLLNDLHAGQALPLPLRSSLQGMLGGRIVATLEEDWEYRGRHYPQGSLVAVTLADMSAEMVYAPRPGEAINDAAVGKTAVFIELLDHVIGRVRRVSRDHDQWTAVDIEMPENGLVEINSVNDAGDDILLSYESLTEPDSLYYVGADDSVDLVQSLPAMYDATEVVTEQRFAISADGTRIPYFLMAKRDVLDKGNAPTVQYGYGGFQVATLPRYFSDPGRPQHGALAGRMWVSRGGVLVLTNIRGGGEFGPAWHEAALKHNRHRAYEDFFAISEALIDSGVTTPDKLGAIGRSNGGLLMGAAMTQRPDLYAAIDCGVPLLDMLRYHRLLAGASWMGEYGNPEMAADRAYLETYSPYQRLMPDVSYPMVFFYTSTKDDRVHPGHARKMAARMAEYGHPFLYYENIEGGHGGTANQKQLARRTAMEYVFFLRELGG